MEFYTKNSEKTQDNKAIWGYKDYLDCYEICCTKKFHTIP